MTAALSAAKTDQEQLNNLLELCRPLLSLMTRQSMGQKMRSREGDSDVVQKTIIEAFQDFAKFQGRTAQEFLAWLKQLHRHNIQNVIRYHLAGKRDLRRDAQLHMSREGDLSLSWYVSADKEVSPGVQLVNSEKALALAAAIQELPEAQRTAITMLAIICVAMEKTPAAVAGLLRRGLQALRQNLGNESSWI